eukprot:m.3407 g.3407  ORF g.3407 m.3407 type:complete len:54 (-) comp5249_c0_seq1:66-227(-)
MMSQSCRNVTLCVTESFERLASTLESLLTLLRVDKTRLASWLPYDDNHISCDF